MSNYERCFEKHSFAELNNIDIELFMNVFSKYWQYIMVETPVFFDIGTNAGSFVKFLENCGIQTNIHCFEPHPVLSKKVKSTYPHVCMNELCLSNTNTKTNIYIPTHSVGLSSLIKRPVFDILQQEINCLEVECMTLDEYCNQSKIDRIDFLKIDVEGAEKMVFDGAVKMLASKQIKCGLFEIGQTLKDAGTSTEEVCHLLESYGYSLDTTISQSDVFFYIANN